MNKRQILLGFSYRGKDTQRKDAAVTIQVSLWLEEEALLALSEGRGHRS